MNTPEYDGANRFPKKQPKGICRGCRNPITEKRRQTWCSTPCKKKFDPFWVKQAVWKRDNGICQICKQPVTRRHDRRYNHALSWEENRAAQREARKMRGEYDHVIAHKDGGHFVVENIRLLCHPCHAKRSGEQRKAWNKAKKLAKSNPETVASLPKSSLENP